QIGGHRGLAVGDRLGLGLDAVALDLDGVRRPRRVVEVDRDLAGLRVERGLVELQRAVRRRRQGERLSAAPRRAVFRSSAAGGQQKGRREQAEDEHPSGAEHGIPFQNSLPDITFVWVADCVDLSQPCRTTRMLSYWPCSAAVVKVTLARPSRSTRKVPALALQ